MRQEKDEKASCEIAILDESNGLIRTQVDKYPIMATVPSYEQGAPATSYIPAARVIVE